MNTLQNNKEKKILDQIINIILNKYGDQFKKEHIESIYVKSLSNSDVLIHNKKNKRGKTSHIACTTKSRNFFYPTLGKKLVEGNLKMDSEDTFDLYIESKHLKKNYEDSFIKTKCTIWVLEKSTGKSQIGLSKQKTDGEEFYELRNKMKEGDILIFFRYLENNNSRIYLIFLEKNDKILDGISLSNPKYYRKVEKTLIDLDLKETDLDLKEANLYYQQIYFGAPGTGKSYQLSEDAKKYFNDENISRVTFHSAYSYGSFVGSYKPFPTINNEITYKYVPGPFIKLITKALRNPNKNYLLIIEEINRADVSYIFGDIFQLLDRDCNGFSTYPIEISEDLKLYFKEEFKELKGEKKEYIVEVLGDDMTKLYIPNNMYIWATMNNADQGVHVLDTAFKRRWYFKGLGINNNEEKISEYRFNINDGTKVNWNKLRRSINNKLISVGVNEDKLLGTFFLSMNELNICQSSKGNFSFNDLFKNKVLMYLYEDLRHYRNEIFKDSNLTYEQLCTKFDDIGLNIFNDLEMNDEED